MSVVISKSRESAAFLVADDPRTRMHVWESCPMLGLSSGNIVSTWSLSGFAAVKSPEEPGVTKRKAAAMQMEAGIYRPIPAK